jgi:serine/threonine protein kinase
MSFSCPFCQSTNRDAASFCNACGRPLAARSYAASTPGSGHQLSGALLDGRYRIDRELGGGGMGTIYLAEDTRLGHIACAIKEMTDAFPAVSDRQYAVERFLSEALMLAKLSHPRIPRVTDHFVESGRYYLVMDYVDGENLEYVLAHEGRPGLPASLVFDWGLQILDVLTYLHEQKQPVIFRDLKPTNIMQRRTDGSLVLMDFGIARLFAPTQAATMTGTPGYAAPEQYQGLAVSGSDLYALAATLHHLLTGRDPQKGTPFTFPPVRSLNVALSPALEPVVTKALSLRVEDRFMSAREVAEAIRGGNESGTQHAITSVVISQPVTAQDNLDQVEETGCLKADQDYISDVAFSSDDRSLATVDREGTILLWDVASGQELWRCQHGAIGRCIALHPDRRLLASGGVDGFLKLWDMDSQKQIRKLDHHSDVLSVAFSPDGAILAAGCEDGRVTLRCKPFDQAIFGSLKANIPVWSLALSSNSLWLVVGCEDGGISAWQPHSIRKVWSVSGSAAAILAVAISPDKRLVASGGEDGAVRLWDLSSGSEAGGFELDDSVESVSFSPDNRLLAACGHDSYVWLWDVNDQDELWYLEGHTAAVTKVVFSSDGRLLASSSNDGSVKLWGLSK